MATQENKPMVSEVSICNQALSWLGEARISSLDDPGTTARRMRDNYPFIRDVVLEERDWTFAKARFTSEVADAPEWGPGFLHPIPLDWLNVTRAYRDVSSEDPSNWIQTEWYREEGNIVAVDSFIYMRGLIRVTDTGKFSGMFTQALATRIAAELCMAFTQDKVRESSLWALYQAKLADAAVHDGKQGRREKTISRTFINARGRRVV